MFKVLNKMGPKSLTLLFTYKSEMSNYELRDISCTLCLPQPRTNNMKWSFIFDGAYIWNSLPKEIRESKSLSCFESKIATHIIDNNIWNHTFCKKISVTTFTISYTFVNIFL